MLAYDRRVRRDQFGARSFEGGSRRQPTEQLGHPVPTVRDHRGAEVMGAAHDVRDDLRVSWIWHRRLEDADDGCGSRTEADGLADDRRVAIERRAPKAMGQNYGGGGPLPAVWALEGTAPRTARAPAPAKND